MPESSLFLRQTIYGINVYTPNLVSFFCFSSFIGPHRHCQATHAGVVNVIDCMAVITAYQPVCQAGLRPAALRGVLRRRERQHAMRARANPRASTCGRLTAGQPGHSGDGGGLSICVIRRHPRVAPGTWPKPVLGGIVCAKRVVSAPTVIFKDFLTLLVKRLRCPNRVYSFVKRFMA